MHKLSIVGAIILAAGISGCATVTRGGKQAFTVESTPSGASVETSLGHKCEATPCTFAKVPRGSTFSVTVSKKGYKTSTHQVTHQTAGGGAAGMAGNVPLGGLIGAAVDANSGATQDLAPNPLRVSLEVEPPPDAPTPTPEASTPAPAPEAPAVATPTVAAPGPAATPYTVSLALRGGAICRAGAVFSMVTNVRRRAT